MASTRVEPIEMILTHTVLFRTVVSLIAFIDIHLTGISIPSQLTLAFASIEIIDTLTVFTMNRCADLIERTIVIRDVFELFHGELIPTQVQSILFIVIEWQIEIFADQDILQTTAKAIADEDLRLSVGRQERFQR